MSDIDWKKVWDDAIKSDALFPHVALENNSISIACPTQFSNTGAFSIDVTPSFGDNSITLSMLLFNGNISIKDLAVKKINKSNFNALVKPIVDYEVSQRISDRYEIKSDNFKSHEEAVNTLIDYLNSKARENGRMFDDKLDELNKSIATSTELENESYMTVLESIRHNRLTIMKSVESILSKYNWKTAKNEDLGDSTASFYDANNNLAAVVSLVDGFIIVDLAKNITAKVSMLQSDEEIESELSDDITAATELIADREVNAMKDAMAANAETEHAEYIESLSNRVTKLENLYIKNKLHKFH